jgi:hypothetical protein
VIEEILLMPAGYLTFRTEEEQLNLNKLTEHMKTRPELKKKLYLIVRCFMTAAELESLLADKSSPVTQIMSQLDRLSFNGIELRCDEVLTNKTKPLFKEFVNELRESFEKRKDEREHTCAETVSIRFVI